MRILWKKDIAVCIFLILLLTLTGCGYRNGESSQAAVESEAPSLTLVTPNTEEETNGNEADQINQPEKNGTEKPQPGETDRIEETEIDISEQSSTSELEEEKTSEAVDFSFKDLKNWRFSFGSGVGAWSTDLSIREDGSFSGLFSDWDMGNRCEEYPNGTRYFCSFSGKFAPPVKVNEYTYSTRIEEIHYENEAGTENIVDGAYYIYSDAHGLEDADEILIYLPGTPFSVFSENFLYWLDTFLYNYKGDTLPCYALNNTIHQYGFVGIINMAEVERDLVSRKEEKAAEIELALKKEGLSQAEMNTLSGELYSIWDDLLNSIWNDLKDNRDEKIMEEITQNELEWITWKEEEIKKAGAGLEEGTSAPFARNMRAAELTKARVYELLELFR